MKDSFRINQSQKNRLIIITFFNKQLFGTSTIHLATRKSFCVNARGLPPATKQVLAMLLSLGRVGGEVPPSSHGQGGVPHPRSRGGGSTPSRLGWGGYPIPGLDWRYPPPEPGMGYPPDPDLGWGTPHPDLRQGTPHQLDGYPPPCLNLGWGTPQSAGRGTPPISWMGYSHQLDGIPPFPAWTWDGVPPPPVGWMGYPTES